MHQPLYRNLFTGRRKPTIVSNIFGCCPTSIGCSQVQTYDVLQNSLLPENLQVNSSHLGKSKESNMLDYQSISFQTSNQINNMLTDSCPVTTNNSHVHLPVDLTKLLNFESPPFEGSEFSQDGEALQPPLMVTSGPHVLEKRQGQLQTRVSKIYFFALGFSSISTSPSIHLFYPFHQIDHPQHHDEISKQIDESYPTNISTNRQCLSSLPLDLGWCMNGCVSFIDNFRFQVHLPVYHEEIAIELEQYIMAHSLVSSDELPIFSHDFQVSLVVGEKFCMLVLNANIFVLGGRELMQWLHWKYNFT